MNYVEIGVRFTQDQPIPTSLWAVYQLRQVVDSSAWFRCSFLQTKYWEGDRSDVYTLIESFHLLLVGPA